MPRIPKKIQALIDEDEKILLANKKMKAKLLFDQRKKYIDEVPTHASNGKKIPYIDMWYESTLYGRVDENIRPVYLSETNLTMVAEEVPIVDFVADAFRDFRAKWTILTQMGVVEPVGLVKDLIPFAGWKSMHEAYHLYMEEMFSDFQAWVRDNNYDYSMLGFKNFLEIFMEYVDVKSPHTPITRSEFIISSKVGPEYSGLVLDLHHPGVSHDNDFGKYQSYLKDPNYELYVLTAEQFGFYVDKNAPWRLVANINSDVMLTYMRKYGIGSQKVLFQKYYYKARNKDLDSLRPYLVSFWNSFASAYPFQKRTYVAADSSGGYVTRAVTHQRTLVPNGDPSIVSNRNWMKILFYIRAKQGGELWSQGQYDFHVQQVIRLYLSAGYSKALQYMGNKLSTLPSNGNPGQRKMLDSYGEPHYNTRGSTNNVGSFRFNTTWSDSAVSDSG